MARDNVDLKLKRALEAKIKLEQDRLRKLEEKRQKREERRKNATEVAASKRKQEEIERREREEKRKRRLEEARKQQREVEERLRAEMEEKEQKRKVLVEYGRIRKAMEEEAKKQRRIDKKKEAAERRQRIEDDAKQICMKSNKYASKDAKRMEEVHQHKEPTLQIQKEYAAKVLSMSTRYETEAQSMLVGEATSYEISSYEDSEEEDNNNDFAPGKVVPTWTRTENLIPQIISQQYIDPDEIFGIAKFFNLNEVFESNGSHETRDFKRRSYSGESLHDTFTEEEEYLYKLRMGYI
ncbi:hypothetical protein SUGI_1134030 [Cryptomeria japonica]|uniref:vicilin-like seed storage protein At2g18540 n=1 Tax=Cryptomeria japonica TaxID=3369 RepID=UPI002414BFAE|nr:vicilin-like seed storage protein At2g18540 [Cryptomeria japonica]GLJ53209.1 hypothetical protein SUGI_1134030 [Cryptomeria japonica]